MRRKINDIENFGKWLAVLSSMSLGVSIIFDYGFYSALNMDFSDVPTLMTDHIRSMLLWLPILITALFLIVTFEVITRSLFATQENRGNNKLFKILIWIAKPLHLIFLLFCCFLLTFYGDRYPGTKIIVSIYLYSSLANHILSRPQFAQYQTIEAKVAFIIFPTIMFVVYQWGYSAASAHFHGTIKYSNIIKQDNEPERLIILREIERGLLVSDASRKIVFIPWSEIKRIETVGRYVDTSIIGKMHSDSDPEDKKSAVETNSKKSKN